MPSLDGIKTRIKSVEATAKITSAMELVATAKFKRAKDTFEKVGAYSETVYTKINELMATMDSKGNPYLEEKEGNTLHIVITSDLGLCGGYNGNVLRMLASSWSQGDKVITIGNKGASALKNLNKTPIAEFGDVGNQISYEVISQIIKEALTQFTEEESNISKLSLIYTKFINSVTFETTALQLLPASLPEDFEVKPVDYSFEPSATAVFEGVIPLYLGAVLFGKAAESQLSEQASRKTSMGTATDNANEMIDELKIEFNRARQANITQEIAEIVGGAAAI